MSTSPPRSFSLHDFQRIIILQVIKTSKHLLQNIHITPEYIVGMFRLFVNDPEENKLSISSTGMNRRFSPKYTIYVNLNRQPSICSFDTRDRTHVLLKIAQTASDGYLKTSNSSKSFAYLLGITWRCATHVAFPTSFSATQVIIPWFSAPASGTVRTWRSPLVDTKNDLPDTGSLLKSHLTWNNNLGG